MRQNLFLVSAIVLAALSSCTKDSELDPTIESAMNAQIPMSFSTYASSATTTKATAVNSNDDFKGKGDIATHGSFKVAALAGEATFSNVEYDSDNNLISYTATPTDGTAVSYFGLTDVTYDKEDEAWVNSGKMYWPNASKLLFFAAYSPSDAGITDYSFSEITEGEAHDENCKFSFNYTVTDELDDQIDLMYAMKEVPYIAPTDQSKSTNENSYITTGVMNTNSESSVNLHFKHALTQIAFTAIKSDDLEVYVKSITICNLYNSGTFEATELTDDEDVMDEDGNVDNDTVGETALDGDKVDADKFGEWTTVFNNTWYELEEEPLSDLTYPYRAKAGSGGNVSMSNYKVALIDYTDKLPATTEDYDAIKIGSDRTKPTQLTSTDRVLLVMPQTATKWVPTTSTSQNFVGYANELVGDLTDVDLSTSGLTTTVGGNTYSATSTDKDSHTYLAIECVVYDVDGSVSSGAEIHSGYIFVPFSSADIDYASASTDNGSNISSDAWLPGYKITYCLDFTDLGYISDTTTEEDGTITTVLPEPGCIPDTQTSTLREITYTTSVDTFVGSSESTTSDGDSDGQ